MKLDIENSKTPLRYRIYEQLRRQDGQNQLILAGDSARTEVVTDLIAISPVDLTLRLPPLEKFSRGISLVPTPTKVVPYNHNLKGIKFGRLEFSETRTHATVSTALRF